MQAAYLADLSLWLIPYYFLAASAAISIILGRRGEGGGGGLNFFCIVHCGEGLGLVVQEKLTFKQSKSNDVQFSFCHGQKFQVK